MPGIANGVGDGAGSGKEVVANGGRGSSVTNGSTGTPRKGAAVPSTAAVKAEGSAGEQSEADAQELAMRLQRLELALEAERREREEEKRVRLEAEERVKMMERQVALAN